MRAWPQPAYAAFAIRSAIMIVVGFEATDGMTGMIDASMTRASPSNVLDGAMGVDDGPTVVTGDRPLVP